VRLEVGIALGVEVRGQRAVHLLGEEVGAERALDGGARGGVEHFVFHFALVRHVRHQDPRGAFAALVEQHVASVGRVQFARHFLQVTINAAAIAHFFD
jgi:hypothetical protein